MLFTEKDTIVNIEDLKRNLHTVEFNGSSIVSYNSADGFIIQSTDFLSGKSVPRFLLRIFNDLKFEAYHCGVRCTIRTLTVNRICVFNMWSHIQEGCRFLNYCEITPKKCYSSVIKYNEQLYICWRKELFS